MATRAPGYVLDLADPRAPTSEQWASMTPEERARVVEMLPSEFDALPIELAPPEGDHHRKAASNATSTLDAYFRRLGRKVYLSSNLPVFYPGEPWFAPDLLAVLDVDPHDRGKWVVDHEQRGLDFALEIHVAGERKKDLARNVERFARLGIPEYFVFDRSRLVLRGFRLPDARARSYAPILPQEGRYPCSVLGLELAVVGDRLRFHHGTAALEDADELIAKLGTMLTDVLLRHEEAELRASMEAERATAEAERAKALEAALAEARAEIAHLRGKG